MQIVHFLASGKPESGQHVQLKLANTWIGKHHSIRIEL